MGAGGKGGSTTSSVEIPEWLEEAAQGNLAQAEQVSQIGYTPYYGPDVAAFTPTQEASFQNTSNAANAFGMAAPSDPMAGMPQAQTFANGVTGYSSAPLYEQSLGALATNKPGQYDAINSLFIDPMTGGGPSNPVAQTGYNPNDPFAQDAGGPDNNEFGAGDMPSGTGGLAGFSDMLGGLKGDLGIGGNGGMGGGK